MSEVPFQRRLERQLIRQQARIEAGAGDRWIPTVVVVLLGAVLIRAGLDRLDALDTGRNLAAYSQSLWLLSEGKMPEASLFGPDVHVLERNWTFILYPLGALATVVPAAELLIVVQSAALAIAVLPLWWLARSVAKLRVGAATALIGAYALHPATHRLGTEDFNPASLAVPALIAMAFFGATKRWPWYWAAIAFALACRADLGLAVALWGFVVLGSRERTVGLWTLGVGLFWSLGLLMIVHPIIGQTPLAPETFGGTDGTFLGDVLLDAVRDPVRVVQDLVARENITLIVGLLAPVIFLPLLSLRYLAPALPLGVLYLAAGAADEAIFAERAAMLLAFVLIAATYALNRLGNMGVDRVFLDVRILSTLAATAMLIFVADSPISPYERPWEWDRQTSVDASIMEAIELIEDDVAVRASPAALAELSDRDWIFALDTEQEPVAALAGFPDYTLAVLVVDEQIPERTQSSREAFDQGMTSQGFQLVYDENGVALYSRQDGDAVVPDG
ncbi:MAG: DUF2079 domain-containing protein [Actinomycetota bacterium]